MVRSIRFLCCFLLAPLALTAPPRSALAEDLIIESWVGGPSPQERQWASSVRDDLTRSGFLAAPAEIIKALGSRMPMPPLASSEEAGPVDLMGRFSAARATFSEAVSLYRGGRFQAAERLFAVLVAEAQRNPLIFASEVARPIFREAMIYLVLSRSRLRQPAAAAAAAEELVRTFPRQAEQVFVEFGPTADRLYRTAETKLAAQGHGTLLVEVNDADAVVIVNEGMTNNRAFEGEVPPGTYRVMVKTSSDGARRYEVPVRANETTRLTIDWQVDRALSLSPESVALIFDSDRARSAEGKVGVLLARTLGKGPRIVLIGSRIYDGYRAISASLYDVQSGRHLRTALAVMDGKRLDAKLHALREFLRSGRSSPNVVLSDTPLDTVAELPSEQALADSPAPPPAASRWPAYVAGLAAIGAFGGGIALVQYDHRDGCADYDAPCSSGYSTVGYGLFGTSLLLAGYAAYRWTVGPPAAPDESPRRRKQLSGSIAPMHGGAMGWVGWGF